MSKERKDEKIEKLFSAFAEEVKPDRSVTEKAKQYLEAKNPGSASAGKTSHAKNREKKPLARRLVLAGAAACGVVLCAMVAVQTFQFIGKGGSSGGNSAEDPGIPGVTPAPDVTRIYSSSEIYTRSIGTEELPEEFDFSWLQGEGIEISEVREYRFKSDSSLAFVRLVFSLPGASGVTEAQLDVEVSAESYEKFTSYRELVSYGSVSGVDVLGVTGFLDGEYLSNAYFEDFGARFYLEVLSPDRDSLSDMLALILSEK